MLQSLLVWVRTLLCDLFIVAVAADVSRQLQMCCNRFWCFLMLSLSFALKPKSLTSTFFLLNVSSSLWAWTRAHETKMKTRIGCAWVISVLVVYFYFEQFDSIESVLSRSGVAFAIFVFVHWICLCVCLRMNLSIRNRIEHTYGNSSRTHLVARLFPSRSSQRTVLLMRDYA